MQFKVQYACNFLEVSSAGELTATTFSLLDKIYKLKTEMSREASDDDPVQDIDSETEQ